MRTERASKEPVRKIPHSGHFAAESVGIHGVEKGELDKIVERSAEHFNGPPISPDRPRATSPQCREEPYRGRVKDERKKKEKSEWLGEILDIFD